MIRIKIKIKNGRIDSENPSFYFKSKAQFSLIEEMQMIY